MSDLTEGARRWFKEQEKLESPAQAKEREELEEQSFQLFGERLPARAVYDSVYPSEERRLVASLHSPALGWSTRAAVRLQPIEKRSNVLDYRPSWSKEYRDLLRRTVETKDISIWNGWLDRYPSDATIA